MIADDEATARSSVAVPNAPLRPGFAAKSYPKRPRTGSRRLGHEDVLGFGTAPGCACASAIEVTRSAC